MEIIACLSMILCGILLFLYIRLKKEIRSLHKQVQYQNETSGTFRNFSLSSDRDLRILREDIQRLHDIHLEDQANHIRSERQLKEMFTNISHDIRTPLTSIRGYLQLLEESTNEQDRERYLSILQERFVYLKELLEELFLYSKVSHSGYVVQYEQVRPCQIVSQVLISMYEDFNKQDMQMEICYETEAQTIISDSFLIQRVIMNLFSNMLKYGKGNCRIQQKTTKDDFVIEFSNEIDEVLSETKIEQLFERFTVLDPTKSAHTSGLGLAIVKTIMEKLQGSVSARCENHQLVIAIQFPYTLN